MKQKSVKSKIILTVLGVILGLLFISPFWTIVTNSFKTKKELFLSTLSLPSSFNLQNYKDAFEALDFFILEPQAQDFTFLGLDGVLVLPPHL